MNTGFHTLEKITEAAAHVQGVRKRDLQDGDWVVVKTKNSVYTICVVGDDLYCVSGGWFDRHGGTQTMTIKGCTWGGSAIKQDILAAPGLCLEFGNQVMTTRIREVRVIRGGHCTSRN
jgi:hypothetical protein